MEEPCADGGRQGSLLLYLFDYSRSLRPLFWVVCFLMGTCVLLCPNLGREDPVAFALTRRVTSWSNWTLVARRWSLVSANEERTCARCVRPSILPVAEKKTFGNFSLYSLKDARSVSMWPRVFLRSSKKSVIWQQLSSQRGKCFANCVAPTHMYKVRRET